MDDQEKKKLCWECGAEVSFDATECPFCGAQFEVAVDETSAAIAEQSSEAPFQFTSPDQVESPQNPEFETVFKDGELPFGLGSEQLDSELPHVSDEVILDQKDASSNSESQDDLFLEAGEEEDLIDLSSHASTHDSGLFSSTSQEKETQEEPSSKKGYLFNLCLIIPGLSLLLFGLGMVLFSENGQLTLRWDASYGLFVFTLSALFIYLGARAFKKM